MKSIITFLFILALSTVFSQSSEYKIMLSKYYNDFATMSIEDVLMHVNYNDAYLIDVREKSEFKVSHIQKT